MGHDGVAAQTCRSRRTHECAPRSEDGKRRHWSAMHAYVCECYPKAGAAGALGPRRGRGHNRDANGRGARWCDNGLLRLARTPSLECRGVWVLRASRCDCMCCTAGGHSTCHAAGTRCAMTCAPTAWGEVRLCPRGASGVQPRIELSSREQEVLGCAREGLCGRAIAERLGLSRNTARNHVARITARSASSGAARP